MRIIHWGGRMVAEHFKGDTLFCHRYNRFFVHVSVVDAHTAKDCKCLNEVFIIFRENLIESEDREMELIS